MRSAISRVLSQITLDQYFSNYMTYEDSVSLKSGIGQWNLIVFFSQKMILTKTHYKIYNQKLMAIVEIF